MPGQPTDSKPINLSQLRDELAAAGVAVGALGVTGDVVHTYSAAGEPMDFSGADRAKVNQVVTAHVARREKTNAEYVAEFGAAATSAERKQEIRDMVTGLLPREQVPA
jgi:hypothetical protein